MTPREIRQRLGRLDPDKLLCSEEPFTFLSELTEEMKRVVDWLADMGCTVYSVISGTYAVPRDDPMKVFTFRLCYVDEDNPPEYDMTKVVAACLREDEGNPLEHVSDSSTYEAPGDDMMKVVTACLREDEDNPPEHDSAKVDPCLYPHEDEDTPLEYDFHHVVTYLYLREDDDNPLEYDSDTGVYTAPAYAVRRKESFCKVEPVGEFGYVGIRPWDDGLTRVW